jgi:hypothetical protein
MNILSACEGNRRDSLQKITDKQDDADLVPAILVTLVILED